MISYMSFHIKKLVKRGNLKSHIDLLPLIVPFVVYVSRSVLGLESTSKEALVESKTRLRSAEIWHEVVIGSFY